MQDPHSSLVGRWGEGEGEGLLTGLFNPTSAHHLGTVWWVGSKLLIANLATAGPLQLASHMGLLSKNARKESSAPQNSGSTLPYHVHPAIDSSRKRTMETS